MDVADIAQTNIYYASGAIGDPDITDVTAYTVIDSVSGTATTYVDPNRANGLHCYYVTHVATNGEESVPSNIACKTVDIRVPGAPQGLTVN